MEEAVRHKKRRHESEATNPWDWRECSVYKASVMCEVEGVNEDGCPYKWGE